ncbi:UTP--glucose-1-phosphate uridylyltransferase GalU [Aerococcus sanguinicola]|uniref:UTP--glucose-1-phosphate uridylyltransferase GalU n=1 Tax=unclassified Aerococcus TaxID=2618060 RepID=UPI0008A470BD|nr:MULTISPECIES: UTP--glucose-1-phosphate uridylyltransferase GalU [unclassified Aerococcus]MDK6233299.1 UTP--glucose-1-phosphate uridylyltransferase GalU [Aerococcus sp. UMB10185]MDK6855127.1 UTP--glucose-1-phosphate uridylyltransferase GalU [Aerococcus sp. UMB7533]MDK8501957.1 UTP--glucose-1-phosphate uridylyltransferase GalU [Aerococcus sp. UMB1112A]OFN04465.1 UTP--glucose-1-phosphate uridylyltransferase [Aerococcus sp. HMSC062A02]OHO42958.1 UTP--glucose-1-phosphate uridylyltransferase [Aer
MKKVRKAIIPAAGFGTRFLPATKAMAKEMLPIVNKPTIQFIVEEALASGIEDILIITGKSKRPLEDYFDSNIELEGVLKQKGEDQLLELIQENVGLNLYFKRQSYPLGLGHAVLQAKAFVGDEPFVVMLGDDLMVDEEPLTKQLIGAYNETHASNIAVMPVAEEDTDKYGIIDPEAKFRDGIYNVRRFVEKPDPSVAPSNLAIIGRYLLTPEIFGLLETQKAGAGNEIQLTDAIDRLNRTQRVFAYEFTGQRYDVGDKLGYMKTTIEYGLGQESIRQGLTDYLLSLEDELNKE